jgi:hypothetical protein
VLQVPLPLVVLPQHQVLVVEPPLRLQVVEEVPLLHQVQVQLNHQELALLPVPKYTC